MKQKKSLKELLLPLKVLNLSIWFILSAVASIATTITTVYCTIKLIVPPYVVHDTIKYIILVFVLSILNLILAGINMVFYYKLRCRK